MCREARHDMKRTAGASHVLDDSWNRSSDLLCRRSLPQCPRHQARRAPPRGKTDPPDAQVPFRPGAYDHRALESQKASPTSASGRSFPIPPPPFGPRFFQLNRECRHGRLAVAVVGQRIDQTSHLPPECEQIGVIHVLQSCTERVEVQREPSALVGPWSQLGFDSI